LFVIVYDGLVVIIDFMLNVFSVTLTSLQKNFYLINRKVNWNILRNYKKIKRDFDSIGERIRKGYNPSLERLILLGLVRTQVRDKD